MSNCNESAVQYGVEGFEGGPQLGPHYDDTFCFISHHPQGFISHHSRGTDKTKFSTVYISNLIKNMLPKFRMLYIYRSLIAVEFRQRFSLFASQIVQDIPLYGISYILWYIRVYGIIYMTQLGHTTAINGYIVYIYMYIVSYIFWYIRI